MKIQWLSENELKEISGGLFANRLFGQKVASVPVSTPVSAAPRLNALVQNRVAQINKLSGGPIPI